MLTKPVRPSSRLKAGCAELDFGGNAQFVRILRGFGRKVLGTENLKQHNRIFPFSGTGNPSESAQS